MSNHRRDLCDLSGLTQPVEARHQRVVQRRRNLAQRWLDIAALHTVRISSSTNNGTPPLRSTTALTVSAGSAVCAVSRATISRALRVLRRFRVNCA